MCNGASDHLAVWIVEPYSLPLAGASYIWFMFMVSGVGFRVRSKTRKMTLTGKFNTNSIHPSHAKVKRVRQQGKGLSMYVLSLRSTIGDPK